MIDYIKYEVDWKSPKTYLLLGVILLVVIILISLIFGGQSKEEKVLDESKKDLVILYPYSEDILRPIETKEKTLDELVEEIVLEQLGLDNNGGTYKEFGIMSGQGAFITDQIIKGMEIPQYSAVPKSSDTDNNKDILNTEETLQRIQKDLEKSSNAYLDDLETNEADILKAKLKERLEEQQSQLNSETTNEEDFTLD